MDYFKFLPYEVTLEILTRVPAESALDCKLVCTYWRNIVSHDPSFNQMHCHHHLNYPSNDSGTLGFLALTENQLFYYFEYNQNLELTTPTERIRKVISTQNPEDNFVGSCNGLICIVQEDEPDRPVSICNPFTKQYVQLPQIRKNTDDDDFWSFGFGFISLTNEYKVVRIYVSLLSKYVEVHIYTLGRGNGWRDLGKFNPEFSPARGIGYEHGKFTNGAIYWIGREIMTFDLIEETFYEHLAPPPMPPNTKLLNHTIGVLDGFLYIAIYDNVNDCCDKWILKENSDNHHNKEGEEYKSLGWSKELRVDKNELLAITKSGVVLTYSKFEDYVNLYDTKASTSKRLVDFKESVYRVFPHKNTLVSLKELGEELTRTIKPVKGCRKL